MSKQLYSQLHQINVQTPIFKEQSYDALDRIRNLFHTSTGLQVFLHFVLAFLSMITAVLYSSASYCDAFHVNLVLIGCMSAVLLYYLFYVIIALISRKRVVRGGNIVWFIIIGTVIASLLAVQSAFILKLYKQYANAKQDQCEDSINHWQPNTMNLQVIMWVSFGFNVLFIVVTSIIGHGLAQIDQDTKSVISQVTHADMVKQITQDKH